MKERTEERRRLIQLIYQRKQPLDSFECIKFVKFSKLTVILEILQHAAIKFDFNSPVVDHDKHQKLVLIETYFT